ncbi:ABC transporter permease subunit [Aerococcaceae bacterium DSM 109653]|uniref:ABC transporter permease subunit n=1 Tax=Fundicoccus ignavus TaxID=2664442 RepID=A0A6I2GG64_9LACT|nr:amino acid ABC transporter permease [Fundicoccus ignavus]MRI82240.1 ABC transporter permease subunit [Fundicoccus ignavus]MRI84491.1 ABC transporter permease subunit [Fundicoccus ignavus]
MLDSGINVLFQGRHFVRLLEGLWVTVSISLVSVLISLILGLVLGFIMTIRYPLIQWATRLYIEFIRIMPQLVLLFLVYFGLTRSFGINLSGEVSAIIVFSIWGTAEMGDLVHGAIQSLPKHQKESGLSIGLTKQQVMFYIILPQIFRRLLPLVLNLITRMIKTTSLIVLIGVVEVVKVGQQIIETSRLTNPTASLWIYGTIFFMYFAICYPLSLISTKLEKYWQI